MAKDQQSTNLVTEHVTRLHYWSGSSVENNKNVGDYYGFWLATKLNLNPIKCSSSNIELFLCGSQLGYKKFDKNTIVVGGGFHNAWDTTNLLPTNVLGVRGKLSAAKFDNKVPAIGDTGLFVTRLLNLPDDRDIKYDFGLVCHWRDLDFFRQKYVGTNINIISTYTENVPNFINQLRECKVIFSTSLHGIIFAHAAGIPAIHLERKMLESKDNFKFKDYYSMLDCSYFKIVYNDDLNFADLIREYTDYDAYKPSAECLTELQDKIGDALSKAVAKLTTLNE